MATNSIVPMATGEDHNDTSGLGRWSTLSFRGQDDKKFTVITAYRVCKGSIQSSPIGSAYSREHHHHKHSGIKQPNPRTLILKALQITIQKLHQLGHSILLMMDSNGSLDEDLDLQQFLQECNLSDLHDTDPAPSTYIGSSHRRIDHILGCPMTRQALNAAGSMSYIEGPQSDHRGLFVDLDIHMLLHRTLKKSALEQAHTRSLKSGNPEAVETYNNAMLQYYSDHHMHTRLTELMNATNGMRPDTDNSCFESVCWPKHT